MQNAWNSTSCNLSLPVLLNFSEAFVKFEKKRENEMFSVSQDPAVVCQLFLNPLAGHGK